MHHKVTRAVTDTSFALVLAFWIGFYILSWKRKEHRLIQDWGGWFEKNKNKYSVFVFKFKNIFFFLFFHPGLEDQEGLNEPPRPDFHGEPGPSPINNNETEWGKNHFQKNKNKMEKIKV